MTADASPTGQGRLGLELHTRFLLPFCLNRLPVAEATQIMEGLVVGPSIRLWARAEPPEAYKDEVLPHVQQFLFPGAQPSARASLPTAPSGPLAGYLKVTNDAVNRLFHSVVLRLPEQNELPVKPVGGFEIELFLTGMGVGVLSIALTPQLPSLTLDQLVSFNYRLSRAMDSAELHYPSTGEAAEAVESGSPLWRAVPREQRPGRPPDRFRLAPLMLELLAPLARHGFQAAQTGLVVYSVVRFGADVDFDQAASRDELAPALSALAQVEEPGHAGALSGSVSVPQAVLNRRHWVAVGLLGAAHFLADQPAPPGKSEHPFNSQRVPRVRDKYFALYLIALLQRVALQRASGQATEHVTRPDQMEALHRELLEFGVGGHFTQVSSRHALQRFYRLSQEGLEVPTIWEEIRRSIGDLVALESARQQATIVRKQADMSQSMDQSLKTMIAVHRSLEWVEVFAGSYYAGHLSELAAKVYSHFVMHKELSGDLAHIANLGGAFIAFLLLFFFIDPLGLRTQHHH